MDGYRKNIMNYFDTNGKFDWNNYMADLFSIPLDDLTALINAENDIDPLPKYIEELNSNIDLAQYLFSHNLSNNEDLWTVFQYIINNANTSTNDKTIFASMLFQEIFTIINKGKTK